MLKQLDHAFADRSQTSHATLPSSSWRGLLAIAGSRWPSSSIARSAPQVHLARAQPDLPDCSFLRGRALPSTGRTRIGGPHRLGKGVLRCFPPAAAVRRPGATCSTPVKFVGNRSLSIAVIGPIAPDRGAPSMHNWIAALILTVASLGLATPSL